MQTQEIVFLVLCVVFLLIFIALAVIAPNLYKKPLPASTPQIRIIKQPQRLVKSVILCSQHVSTHLEKGNFALIDQSRCRVCRSNKGITK